MSVPLDTLLASAPYLADLAQRHADWFATARALAPDAALAAVLAEVAAAGRASQTEEEVGKALRIGKGRVALLAAASETGGTWTTAQSTAALADLADAALDAGLNLLMRRAAAKGDLTRRPGSTPASCRSSPR